jgi:hypothetical protein
MRHKVCLAGFALLLGGFWGWSYARVGAREDDREAVLRPIRVERSFPAPGIRQVRTDVKVGTIRVHTDSPGAIQVTAVRRVDGRPSSETLRWLEQTRVEIERQGAAVVVRDIVPENGKPNRNEKSHPRLDVTIHMPPDLAVEATTGVGDAEVAGQVGDLALKTGVGNVRLSRLSCSGDDVAVNAGVGEVVMALQSLPRRRVKVEVGVGQVTLNLPDGARASVEMSSGVGQVRSAFHSARARRAGLNLGGAVSGDVNGGGTPIQVKVGVGDAALERADR